MEPYHNPRLRHASTELALTPRGTIQAGCKGGMRKFLPMRGDDSAHCVKETEK